MRTQIITHIFVAERISLFRHCFVLLFIFCIQLQKFLSIPPRKTTVCAFTRKRLFRNGKIHLTAHHQAEGTETRTNPKGENKRFVWQRLLAFRFPIPFDDNPVTLIPFKRAERQSRAALATEEIYAFLKQVELPEFEPIKQGAYLLYFFGLRPCEIDEETHREGDFLIARNRKRKQGKIEYKKIPVPKEAQGLIQWDKPLIFNCTRITRDRLFKKLLGDCNKTAYCLRHTFASICAQSFEKSKFSGETQIFKTSDLVELWLGDSPERLVGKTYIHYSDDFMRKLMDLVEFPTLETCA